MRKAPEKPKEEPKPEPKRTKVRIPKAKKYEDLPEIPDYERAELEIYEETEMDDKERKAKLFEMPEIKVAEEGVPEPEEVKRKGSYQRGSASENGTDKSDVGIRKGSLKPISETEALAPTLKTPPPIIEVWLKCKSYCGESNLNL